MCAFGMPPLILAPVIMLATFDPGKLPQPGASESAIRNFKKASDEDGTAINPEEDEKKGP